MRRGAEKAAVEDASELPSAEVDRIEHLQREASIGRLTSGLLHDVNQPATLGVMSSGELERCIAELSKELQDAPDQIRERLRQIQDLTSELALAMHHLRSLVRDAHSFGAPSDAESRSIDLNDLVVTACRLVRREIEEHAELRHRLGKVPPVSGEPSRLMQVLVNLLLNAGQAVKKRHNGFGTVSVATRALNGHVLIEVEDDGCGISPALRKALFTPFASTRQTEGGMGLGLWMASRIVREHGGTLDYESVIGRGTRFVVELPVDESNA